MSTKKDTPEQPPEPAVTRVTVTLRKPHRHRGKDCLPGDEIELQPRQAAWLRGLGVV